MWPPACDTCIKKCILLLFCGLPDGVVCACALGLPQTNKLLNMTCSRALVRALVRALTQPSRFVWAPCFCTPLTRLASSCVDADAELIFAILLCC